MVLKISLNDSARKEGQLLKAALTKLSMNKN